MKVDREVLIEGGAPENCLGCVKNSEQAMVCKDLDGVPLELLDKIPCAFLKYRDTNIKPFDNISRVSQFNSKDNGPGIVSTKPGSKSGKTKGVNNNL